MYAVVGATGNTGRAVVKELRGLGENPVCVVRNADKAKEVLGADAKTAVAELDDRAGMEKALAGAKRVFIVTGHNPKSDVQQINVIDAAKAAGAEYIVKVSGGRDVIGPNVESINGQAHYKIEEHLKKSGLQWTILSPGLFMQNIMGQAASIKNDGKIVQPWPKDLPVALIEEFAKVIGEVIGKPINYVEVTLEQAEAAMKARNMPDWLVAHLVSIARAGGKGAFSKENTQPIRDIVGRAPITTRQFVQDYKAAFS
jgi:NAD(P)H dehydrogenase (quinone)